ncbi:hypothetical protein F4083_06595, partial [Candidatus Poribacteria bacterium]|nr:hypothetical protein [Candidatus Poribacteria bacterium]
TVNEYDVIHLWDVATGEVIQTIQRDWGSENLVFSADSQTLASCGWDVNLWDTNTGKSIKTLNGHIDSVFDIAFSHDGRTLASCGRDSTVILWDIENLDDY